MVHDVSGVYNDVRGRPRYEGPSTRTVLSKEQASFPRYHTVHALPISLFPPDVGAGRTMWMLSDLAAASFSYREYESEKNQAWEMRVFLCQSSEGEQNLVGHSE